ncbi:MAG: type B 50S ribosomal protein L31 [Acidobacteriota bacterium]
MKADIHPSYHPVVFVDGSTDYELITRSTMVTDEVREIDGVDHYVVRLEISSESHPFYTGKQRFVDTAGRIEKFRRKYRGGSKKS